MCIRDSIRIYLNKNPVGSVTVSHKRANIGNFQEKSPLFAPPGDTGTQKLNGFFKNRAGDTMCFHGYFPVLKRETNGLIPAVGKRIQPIPLRAVGAHDRSLGQLSLIHI